MSIDSDLIRGHVDTIILKTLTTGDKYGYEIIKEINEKSNGTYELKQPTLYSCLKRLENQGLISAYWKNSDIGGKRHYYKLTKKGRENYEANMNEWFSSRNIIDNLMGSKTVTAPEDSEIVAVVSEEEKLDEPSTPLAGETTTETEDNLAQLVLDETNTITLETEPRDFENKSLDEDETAMLEGYYRTDENQINFLDFSLNSEQDETKLEPEQVDTVEQDNEQEEASIITYSAREEETEPQEKTEPNNQEMLDAFFHKYEGTDVNKYKQNTSGAYYDKIKDDSDAKILDTDYGSNHEDYNFPTYNEENSDEDAEESNDYELKLFGGDNTDYINNERIIDDEPEDYYGKSENEPNYFGNNLNFGSSFDDDNDDDLSMPTSFLNIDHRSYEENSKTEEFEINDYASSFGSDSDLDDDNLSAYNKEDEEPHELELFEESEPTVYSRQSNNFSAAARPAFTELEHKEKLNQLSSYTTAPSFDLKLDEPIENGKDYQELKEDFNDAGLVVRTYEKKTKAPQEAKSYLLVNKIKCVTSWINYGIIILLLALTYLISSKLGYNDLSLTTSTLSAFSHYIIAAGIMLVLPGFYTALFMLNKTKKIKPNYSGIISIIFSLLFFIVLINVIYLVNILLGFTRFTQTDYNHLLWLIPSVCSLFILTQSVIYTILYKTKRFMA